MPDTVYIIDLYSLIFQVFHAIQEEMSSPTGQPTNAVYGFTRDIITLLRDKRPSHLIGALDSSGGGKREELFPAYKAQRSEMPVDLRSQIPLILQVLEGFRVPVIEHAGWEADDVIATVARVASERELEVAIVTSDKDARQLISPRVRIYNMRKRTFMGADELLADWGVAPHQAIDFQALVGDSVDNIPGVPLIGPKKAAALLQQFGTLEGVLANADQAPGAKLKENLKTFADQARMSRQLCALITDLPLEIDWEAARTGFHDLEKLSGLCRDFGFRSFPDEIAKLERQAAAVPSAPIAGARATQGRLFSEASLRNWEIVDTPEKFARFVERLRGQRKFCLDLETTSLDAVRADIVGWAFSWQAGHGWYLPVQGPAGQAVLDGPLVVETLRPVLQDPETEVLNQNIKYDMLVLRRVGIQIARVGMDPMVGSYLLDAGARSHGLDELARRYLEHQMIPISDLIGTGKSQLVMSQVDVARVAEYASEDADVAWQLAERMEAELRREKLWDLYWELERRLIPVLVDMEHAGIRVNPELLRVQSADAAVRLGQMQQEIYDIAGREFNIASPLHLKQLLFQDLNLPVLKRTKTGPSTDQDVLERLALLHPLPAKLIEHRKLAKLKSTYLDALPALINPETGNIHASFNQVVAATGRLSSSDPNLQNIPIRTEEGRRVREAFTASREGWHLLCADYSQIELRMLAHFSRDPVLLQAFADGIDIHAAVAADIFGVPIDAVDAEQRRVAKAVNFGVIYGQSAFGLAQTLGISKGVAAQFIDDYFARYAGVETFLRSVLEECRRTGYAVTIRGRRREIRGIRPSFNLRQLNMPERTATNAVIQGSAADLIKLAMIKVHARLQREGHPGRLLLQIHDELVLECPIGELPGLASIVREEMERALTVDVPLEVDVSTGPNWLQIQPI